MFIQPVTPEQKKGDVNIDGLMDGEEEHGDQ